ncbi:DUF4350 domain-containing protein [Nonomuraea cavernae]|uniref:Membrane protein n=1 Tax=Nonomuraea cavernae TaxID=2045107 RepID=A0A918DP24_9ACTN|nr:DUF4350 domain-containing protein [Nonomuraea cavernae]MCA2185755.1 DUF4350 domain-containing protein [Nonomuraea cavernae]GGO75735.1 putative membrane protein [Nonomuraea cavernae]
MSVDLRPGETQGSHSTSPTVCSVWRTGRAAVALGLVILAVGVLITLFSPEQGESRPLDPADTSLAGSKALAQLLRDRGVTVDRVDSVEAAVAKATEPGRLLLVTATWFTDDPALARVPGDRVIVGSTRLPSQLAPGVRDLPGGSRERSREPECPLPAATAAGSVFIGGSVLTGPPGSTGCYPAGKGWSLVSYPHAGGTITVVGSGEFMSNLRLSEDGNAALALNLLGTAKAVTWLVEPDQPAVGDLAGPEGKSVHDLMPPGIPWAVGMAAITVLLLALWRGRRLGPVVMERLPVVVRAAETVEGRGRLYRARRARASAADSLRAGTIDRVTPRLGLGSGAERHEVVAALAVRTGQDPQQVGAALYGPAPVDDAGLVALAGYLDAIERTVSEH